MKKRIMCGVLAIALLSVIGQASAYELRLKGSGSGMITGITPGPEPLVTISAGGEGEASQLGKFTRQETIVLNSATGTVSGTVVFTAADGSELYSSFAGMVTGPGRIEGTYTFTDGTGRFADAGGSASFVVTQSDMVNFTFEFAGTININ